MFFSWPYDEVIAETLLLNVNRIWQGPFWIAGSFLERQARPLLFQNLSLIFHDSSTWVLQIFINPPHIYIKSGIDSKYQNLHKNTIAKNCFKCEMELVDKQNKKKLFICGFHHYGCLAAASYVLIFWINLRITVSQLQYVEISKKTIKIRLFLYAQL